MSANEGYKYSDSINEIRARSTEEVLESKLETVWLTQGYSKSSVKEYVTHLTKELEYQKESFKAQLKEIMDEKERLLSEKNILCKQLEDSVAALKAKQTDNSKEYIKVIDSLKKQLEEKNDDSTVEELQTKLKDLNSYCETLEVELFELKNAPKSEDGESFEKSNDFEVLENENKKLNEELKELSKKFAEIKKLREQETIEKDLTNTKVIYESRSEDFNRLKKENQLLQTEIVSLTRSLQNLNARVVLQTEKYNEAVSELEIERRKNNDSIGEKTELQVRLASYIEKFAEYQDQIEYLEKSTGILKRQLEEQRDKNRMLSGLDTKIIDGLKVTKFINEEETK